MKKIIVIFILSLILLVNRSVAYSKSVLGKFEILNGSYGQTAIVVNKNEIFLPVYSIGNSKATAKILPAQIYDIKQKKFISLNSYINYPSMGYLTVKLNDGRILIWGGKRCRTDQKEIKNNAEIYNPTTNIFKTVGPTNFWHEYHVNSNYIKLNDGKIFMISGPRAEIFDPQTEKFYIAGEPSEYYEKSILDRQGTEKKIKTTQNIYSHGRTALALLNDGRVLLVGANYDKKPGNAEIYDPKTNKFTKVGDQIYPRFYRDATTLQDGRVLVTGGTGVYYGYSLNKKETTKPVVGNAEIFDPKTNTFTAIPPLKVGRSQHRSILLSNGQVLITGGNRGVDMDSTTKDEIFDPKTSTFKTISPAKIERYAFHIEPLSNKEIFINSYNGWEIYKY